MILKNESKRSFKITKYNKELFYIIMLKSINYFKMSLDFSI